MRTTTDGYSGAIVGALGVADKPLVTREVKALAA